MSSQLIILLDKHKDIQDIFKAVFNPPDFDLLVSKSSSEALSKIFSSEPDIVVLDGDPDDNTTLDVLRTIRANSKTSHIPALIMLPEDNQENRLHYDNIGACDFIVKPLTPGKIKNEIESLIKGRTLFGCRMSTRIITFCGAKGGSGTTSLALNCALALTEKEESVIALELANYFSGIRPALDLKTRNTLPFIMAEDPKSLTREHVEKYFYTHSSGLKVIPTISGVADMEKMNAETVRFMRFNLCPVADYAVIDAGHGLNEAALELFDTSDQVIFVASCELASLYNLGLITQVFEGTRINIEKCSVIFNHVHGQGEISESTIKELKLKMPILGFIPNHPAGFLKALNTGELYLSLFPRSQSAKVIKAISEKIHGKFSKTEVLVGAA